MLRRQWSWLVIGLMLVPLWGQQAQPHEMKIWQDFLDWLRRQPPIAASALMPNYKSQLVAEGISDRQAEERLSIIKRLAKERRLELVAIEFDKYYVRGTPNYSKEPNAYLAAVLPTLKPGRALDVGMGQGRNTVFLAQAGWDVTGFDIAGEGIRLAREKAARAGVKITAVESTFEEFDYGEAGWDLVVMTYSWYPMDRPEFARSIYDSLKPGGLVLLEDNEGSLPAAAKSGMNPLLKWFEAFRILRYEVAPSGREWGNPKNAVYRLLAQKP